MTFESLECFVSIARGATFMDTANDFNISQGALSKNIKKMEEELGVKLFDRTGRSVQLTQAGETLLKDFNTFEPYYRAMVTHMHQLSSKRQINVVLGFPGGVLNIKNAVELFKAEHPDIPVNLTIKKKGKIRFAEAAVNSPDLDLIIIHKFQAYNGYTYRTLLEDDPVKVVMPKNHPLAQKSEIKLEDIQNEHILTQEWTEEILWFLSLEYQVRFSNMEVVTGHRQDIIWNVAAGRGIALFFNSDISGISTARVAVRTISDISDFPIIMLSNPNVITTNAHITLCDYIINAVKEESVSYME